MSKRRIFFLSFGLTVAAVLATAFFTGFARRSGPPRLQRVSEKVAISAQLRPVSLAYLKAFGVTKVVDLRPDGEDAKQPSSASIKAAAEERGIHFAYLPIPHDTIPSESVTALSHEIEEGGENVVLYCRTGRRAVRTFALVEASRPDGPEKADAILEMATRAGFSATDLKPEIERRIAARATRAK